MKIEKSCPKSEVWRQNTIGFESCPKVQSLTTRKGWTKGECENLTKLRFQCLLSSCLWAETESEAPWKENAGNARPDVIFVEKNYPDNFWKRTKTNITSHTSTNITFRLVKKSKTKTMERGKIALTKYSHWQGEIRVREWGLVVFWGWESMPYIAKYRGGR